MIKPDILQYAADICERGQENKLGILLKYLAGHKDAAKDMSADYMMLAKIAERANEQHSEAVETRKEKNNLYQRIKRLEDRKNELESFIVSNGLEVPQNNITSICQSDNKRSAPSIRPSVSPSIHSSVKSVPVPVPVRACARARESGSAGTGTGTVDLSKIDTSDEGIMSGAADYVLIAQAVTGDTSRSASAFWRKWVKQGGEAGEGEFREELFTFRRELAAGEDVRNKGAAFTARLKKRRPIKK